MRIMRRILGLAVLCCLASVVAGCSSYNRHWKQATATPAPVDKITGPWEGSWESKATGHKGRLRCIVTELAPDTYSAHFHAAWKRVLSGQYKTELRGRATDGRVELKGSYDMGKIFGGLYHYEATVSPTNFFSTYKSSKDHGEFKMSRPTN